MSKVLVSPNASFVIDSSMFVVNGSWESGYEYNEEVFFMLGLGNNVINNPNFVYAHSYSNLKNIDTTILEKELLSFCDNNDIQIGMSITGYTLFLAEKYDVACHASFYSCNGKKYYTLEDLLDDILPF